ncbi:MAG: 6-phosphofructokinase [Clostridiales bacterium]
MSKTIGILTAGGDCPGLNAVIRAVVKTAKTKYDYKIIGFKDGYRGLVLDNWKELSVNDVSGILDRGGTILGTSNRDNPFKFKADNNGDNEYKDMSQTVIDNLKNHNIEVLVTIGGDGTLTSARDFSRMGLNVIGVPKTIDNDLSGTDLTFGFNTAVGTATEAIDKLHSTAESHHRVMILEVMGRYAGWIALESGIAGGADVILIPEIPYDINRVAEKILERKKKGKSFSLVVVAEGAKPLGGKMVVNKIDNNSPDPIKLGGIGNLLADKLEVLTGLETRVTVLGHLQRGGSPTPFDRMLSTRFGVAAIEKIADKEYGKMICLNGNSIGTVTLEEAVGKLKTVNPNGEYVKIAKSIGLELGDT